LNLPSTAWSAKKTGPPAGRGRGVPRELDQALRQDAAEAFLEEDDDQANVLRDEGWIELPDGVEIDEERIHRTG
jgi:hypothetical protein